MSSTIVFNAVYFLQHDRNVFAADTSSSSHVPGTVPLPAQPGPELRTVPRPAQPGPVPRIALLPAQPRAVQRTAAFPIRYFPVMRSSESIVIPGPSSDFSPYEQYRSQYENLPDSRFDDHQVADPDFEV